MYILDVFDLCKNITFLKVFMYLQILLKFIFIIVPIGLIIMISIDFAKNVLSSDDEDITKNKNIVIQRIIMAIFLFAVPYIVSTFMKIMSSVDNNWYSCYENLGELNKDNINSIAVVNVKDLMMNLLSKDEITSNDLRTMNRYIGYIENEELKNKYEKEAEAVRDKYNKQLEDKTNEYKNSRPKSNLTIVNPSGISSGEGKILLVAGHSYQPYCNQVSNECRGKAASGYAEEDLTRELVLKIKKYLINIGYSNNDIDIANELLGEDMSNSEKTSKSLYVEKIKNTNTFNSINWKRYTYALEIHFNAFNKKANGIETLSITCGNNNKTKDIDTDIRLEVKKLLNTTNRGCVERNGGNKNAIATINYFNSIGVPYTYIETEFYDNKTAIEKYINHSDEVAEIIAKNIKKYYS